MATLSNWLIKKIKYNSHLKSQKCNTKPNTFNYHTIKQNLLLLSISSIFSSIITCHAQISEQIVDTPAINKTYVAAANHTIPKPPTNLDTIQLGIPQPQPTWQYEVLNNKSQNKSQQAIASLQSEPISIPEYPNPLIAELQLIKQFSNKGKVKIKLLGANFENTVPLTSRVIINNLKFEARYTGIDKTYRYLQSLTSQGQHQLSAFNWLMLFAQANNKIRLCTPLENNQTVCFDFQSVKPLKGSRILTEDINDERIGKIMLMLAHKGLGKTY